MRAVLQRVSRAQVEVDGQTTARMNNGLLILLGVTHTDQQENAEKLARKCAQLRIFPDAEEKMNLSLLDVKGSAIVVSQFTLYADTRKGLRPAFIDAAQPEV
ncbi:MAG: D-tyrosyl-tRNA(Tyr) deacylase, partial [Veillonellaceae bacterium]|nr:D-tyrosyl-tRNA(Tyr) deacylase [Veillonellaceae bacterium]